MASAEHWSLRAELESSSLSEDVEAARAAYEQRGLRFGVADGVNVVSERVAGCRAERIVQQSDETATGIVPYLHGGGFSLGSCNTHRHVGAEICRLTGADVWVLSYRLAPENPFPEGLSDSVAAAQELVERYPDAHIALVGDSAGGGLVVSTIAQLTSKNIPVAAAYCMSPWVDLRCKSPCYELKADVDPVAGPELLRTMADRYLAGANPEDPRASPILGKFAGFPPTLIQVGSAEVLFDDAVELSRALGMADVHTRLEIGADMVHVWPCFFPILPEGREAIASGCRFISEWLRKI